MFKWVLKSDMTKTKSLILLMDYYFYCRTNLLLDCLSFQRLYLVFVDSSIVISHVHNLTLITTYLYSVPQFVMSLHKACHKVQTGVIIMSSQSLCIMSFGIMMPHNLKIRDILPYFIKFDFTNFKPFTFI